MYGETFYGRHTAQHQLQWSQIKIRNETNQQRCEKGSILPNQNIFSQFEIRKRCAFSPRNHSEIVLDAHACERNVWVPILFPELFLSS